MALSLKEVRELLLSLWPPGRLYDWYTPTSNVSRYLDALAQAMKTFAYDVVDRLRREVNPAAAVEKLPDWEQALAIDDSYTARNGTVSQRQAAVVSKLREFGAFTLPNTRATLAPLLGYVDPSKLRVLEVDRAAMRSAHTYANPVPVGGKFSVQSQVQVNDGGTVGSAGVQVSVVLPAPASPWETFTLQSPSGTTRKWTTTEVGRSAQYQLFSQDFAGEPCTGTWTLIVGETTFFSNVSLTSWSLFVDGAGPSGLGGDLVEWGAYLDPALAGANGTPPDLDAAYAALSRIEHAHTRGLLLFSLAAIPDAPRTLPDACLPA